MIHGIPMETCHAMCFLGRLFLRSNGPKVETPAAEMQLDDDERIDAWALKGIVESSQGFL